MLAATSTENGERKDIVWRWYDGEWTDLHFADDLVFVHVCQAFNSSLAENVAKVWGNTY